MDITRVDEVEPTGMGFYVKGRGRSLVGKSSLFSLNLTTVEPGGYSKLHKHEWEHGFYVLSGIGIVEVGDEKANVSAGTSVRVPGWIPHKISNVGKTDLVFLNIHAPSPTPEMFKASITMEK